MSEFVFAMRLWNTSVRRRHQRSVASQIQTTKSRHGKTTLALGSRASCLLQVRTVSTDL